MRGEGKVREKSIVFVGVGLHVLAVIWVSWLWLCVCGLGQDLGSVGSI